MDKDLHKLLESSKIEKKDYSRVSSILTRLLETKYNEKVIMERLVHEAKFDKQVFLRYYKQKSREKESVSCFEKKHIKAKEFGFDENSMFGGLIVTFTDYFYDNYKGEE